MLRPPTSFAILTAGPGVQMLVCEKATGRVIHVHNGVIQGTALDVAVNFFNERGLLGIALHPNFPVNGFVYVYYTPSSTGLDTSVSGSLLQHRVERYTWNGATLGANAMISPTFKSRFAQPSSRAPMPGANESSTVL